VGDETGILGQVGREARWAGRWWWQFLRIMPSLQEHASCEGMNTPGWAGLLGARVEQAGGVEQQPREGSKSGLVACCCTGVVG
jgi:hypothetical protein